MHKPLLVETIEIFYFYADPEFSSKQNLSAVENGIFSFENDFARIIDTEQVNGGVARFVDGKLIHGRWRMHQALLSWNLKEDMPQILAHNCGVMQCKRIPKLFKIPKAFNLKFFPELMHTDLARYSIPVDDIACVY